MTSEYIGSELDLFARATRWKSYVSGVLSPHIRGRVLEAGAGIGSNIPLFINPGVSHWLAVEPDPKLAGRIARGDPRVAVVTGTIGDAPQGARYDTILYIDVLEHIEDDRAEAAKAAARLAPGGKLIVLSPAHQFLYSPFDKSIGHFRRYSRGELRDMPVPGCTLVRILMLDSVGFFASLANRLLLRSAMPTAAQIAVWDRWMVPCSRPMDALTFHRFGKTVVAIWQAGE
jgi:SAM-dependent methyltransferase